MGPGLARHCLEPQVGDRVPSPSPRSPCPAVGVGLPLTAPAPHFVVRVSPLRLGTWLSQPRLARVTRAPFDEHERDQCTRLSERHDSNHQLLRQAVPQRDEVRRGRSTN